MCAEIGVEACLVVPVCDCWCIHVDGTENALSWYCDVHSDALFPSHLTQATHRCH